MKLSVIIPVYNEERTVCDIIKKVLEQKNIFEILVIDDGSQDNSVQQVKKLNSKKIKLIQHQLNQGKGAAVITGINFAAGDLVIIQDADLELDPNDYPVLIEPILKKRADFVVGNRWKNYHNFSILRLGNHYLTFLIKILFNTQIGDLYSCYKVGSLKIWRKLNLSSQRFEIEAEIVAKLALLGFKIDEVPINYNPRKYNEGKKIKFIDAFKGTYKLLQIRFSNIIQ